MTAREHQPQKIETNHSVCFTAPHLYHQVIETLIIASSVVSLCPFRHLSETTGQCSEKLEAGCISENRLLTCGLRA